MTKNMGTLDRVIRTVAALAIVGLYLAGRISGTVAVLLGIVAALYLVTSSIGCVSGLLALWFFHQDRTKALTRWIAVSPLPPDAGRR